jgi:GST-like protein
LDHQHILYGARTGNCLRAAVALEEAGLPHTIRKIALRRGEHKGAEFLAINPLGLVPALAVVDDSGGQTIITESNAIMFYAGEWAKDAHLLGVDLLSRAQVLERFFYFLTEAIAPSMAGFKLGGAGITDGARYCDAKIAESLTFADNFVRSNLFMAGERFSLADIAAYTIIAAHQEKLDWSVLPSLDAWFHRVGERPAVQRGMSAFN